MNREQVLIIEDDADIREGVRILLESENYHVRAGAFGGFHRSGNSGCDDAGNVGTAHLRGNP